LPITTNNSETSCHPEERSQPPVVIRDEGGAWFVALDDSFVQKAYV